MINPPINLQDLRRRIYVKAKTEPTWRFWGLYVHVCKKETLQEAYEMAKSNDGAPGIDGVTFEAIEESGVESFLKQIQNELVNHTYQPMPVRKKEIPKDGGTKVRVLSIPAIRDRVVQGALKLILEPIFEADFQPGSYGYRPKRSAREAALRVDKAVAQRKTRVIDLDLRAYFDSVRHDLLLEEVARRVNDADVMRLLKLTLKSTGKKGVPQGGVISPVLSNVYLNEVDKMLEKAIETTRCGQYTQVQYARFADDLVILISSHPKQDWVVRAMEKRLREELAKLKVEINEEKTRMVNLSKGESFGFLGFEFRQVRSRKGKWRAHFVPKMKKRTALLRKLKAIFQRFVSQPVSRVIEEINPILRGWVTYFAIGHSTRCFSYIKQWVEKKIRRHLMRARGRKGFGWKRWSTKWLYDKLGIFNGYRVSWQRAPAE
jgi:RNA-directed DNA polymerase